MKGHGTANRRCGFRVIGLGNPLMGDDGVGIAVVRRLSLLKPGAVEVIDGGTPGLALLDMMAEGAPVILVDAVRMGKAPGTVVRFTLTAVRMETGAAGAHGTGLAEILALGREMDLLPPELVLIGVEPAVVAPGAGLSPPVAAAVEEAVGRVLAEVRKGSG